MLPRIGYRCWLLPFVFFSIIVAARSAEEYPVHPDALPQAGTPKGEVLRFTLENSRIFPGTRREYAVYVPAQYTPDAPACVYVQQDGLNYEAPTVFDNLIAKKAMPVTIGVFVQPGQVPSPSAEGAWDRYNRSFEYDGLGDGYARFLLEELLPDVETKKTSDGRAIRLSKGGNDRAIGGQSSGAICAFTAAWERPDAFTRVFSAIGTYVGLRGGDTYPTLVRKTEPKPIRVFLQDGSNDNDIYAGGWWFANQAFENALTFAGYDVNHVWGEGAHNGRHAAALFPDAMRWLWRDWPETVKAGTSKNAMLQELLIPNEPWQRVGDQFHPGAVLSVNAQGDVFCDDGVRKQRTRISGATSRVEPMPSEESSASVFDEKGRRYSVSLATGNVTRFEPDGRSSVVVHDLAGKGAVIDSGGNLYVTSPSESSTIHSALWLIRPNGEKLVLDEAANWYPDALAISPDHTLLVVSDSRTRWMYSYQIQPDGTLRYKQRFHHLHLVDAEGASGAASLAFDRDGRLYVATHLGVQICDQLGRVNVILPVENHGVSSLVFGGEKRDTLFVVSEGQLFKRRLKTQAAVGWAAPNKTEKPRL